RTTTELMVPVTEDEMAVLQETANEWSLRGPPCEIQCRPCNLTVLHLRCEEESSETSRSSYIDTVVSEHLSSAPGQMRQIPSELVDKSIYNKYIDNGVDFKSMIRDWETAHCGIAGRDILRAMHVPAPPASGKANHEPIMIELDREGCPLVPVIADYSQHHAIAIQGAVRDFLTLHLKFVTGRKNFAISWSALKKDQFAWLREDSLPTDLQLQDPSKMSKVDVQHLLDYWYEQEEAGIQPVEWKSTCPLLRDEPPRVSNIPRPVPRAQEPEAPLPSPQLPLDVLEPDLDRPTTGGGSRRARPVPTRTFAPLPSRARGAPSGASVTFASTVAGASMANRSNEGSSNTRGGPSSITAATSRSRRRPNVAAIEGDDAILIEDEGQEEFPMTS
ncbi:hypothetical protein BC834DRAFT_848498, partial [Gloeopeniophorella convolvens]